MGFDFNCNRILGFLPAVLATVALLTSVLANFWCQTVQYVPLANTTNPDLPVLYFGPWLEKVITFGSSSSPEVIQVGQSCVPFPAGTRVDNKLRTAQVFSILALVLGTAAAACVWIAPFRPGSFGECRWQLLGRFILIFLTLYQGLTFYLLDSEFCEDNPVLEMMGLQESYGPCDWGPGTTCNVLSTVLWYATGTAMCYVVDAPQLPPEELPEAAVVTSGSHKEDGVSDDFTEPA